MWYLKTAGVFAVAAICFSFAGGNAMARGYGQGEHEADGVDGGHYGQFGNSYGYRTGGGGGQGQDGPGGSNGSYVASGTNSQAIGQAQHEGGGYFQSAPVFDASPFLEPRTLIAAQPAPRSSVAIDPRYRLANGTWFYQLPNDRWVRWENGDWVDNDQTTIAGRGTPAIERR